MAATLHHIAIAGTLLKLLLIPSFYSTDFDVHRNWLALTHSLPISQWYYEAISEWTLDYPPFFAWLEYVLSLAAPYWDPAMTVITKEPYVSMRCVLYQRLTVILSDGLLYYALYRFVKHVGWRSERERLVMAASVLLNVGLVLVDHVHFQYNGFLFGMLIMSIGEAAQARPLRAAAWFAVLLNFKHIYLYLAPAYFVYLLRSYCFPGPLSAATMMQGAGRLVVVGGIVVGITLVSLGPFLWLGQLGQLATRMFPFKRGLCHAYWAPNFWAIYALADRVLLAASKLVLGRSIAAPASMTRGLVGDVTFGLLPNIEPWHTFALTLLFQLPALVKLFRQPTTKRFVDALVLCGYASFLFGWHVHEKAVLLMILPMSLVATDSLTHFRCFILLSAAGHVSLLPLLFTPAEDLLKLLLLLLWSIIFYALLGQCIKRPHQGMVQLLGRPLVIYMAGLVVVQAYASPLRHLIPIAHRFEFLPLLLTSIYCAVGVIVSWLLYYRAYFSARPADKQHQQ